MTAPVRVDEPTGDLKTNLRAVEMVWRRELIRFRRSPSNLISGLSQPLVYLVIVAGGLAPLVDDLDFHDFIMPGVIAMAVMFSSLFSAVSIAWDREFGFMREMTVAPVSRTALVVGKSVGGATVSVIQGLLLLLAAPLVGVDLSPIRTLAAVPVIVLFGVAIVTFGIVVATRLKRIESFQVFAGVVVNPMLFLSGAIFPIQELPAWLAVLARLNPTTYGVDAIRRVMIDDAFAVDIADRTVPLWLELTLLAGWAAAMTALAVRHWNSGE